MLKTLLRGASRDDLIERIEQLEEEKEELIAKNQKLKKHAERDPLTGLKNRRGFKKDADAILKVRIPSNEHSKRKIEAVPISILFIDTDHFKAVNDTHGHDVGDEVLKTLARIFEKLVRPTDVVSRFGGEEIIICLDGLDEAQAAQKAEAICESVRALQFSSPKGEFHVTVSIGVASTVGIGFCLDNLLTAADEAAYKAKETGRDRVVRSSDLAR